MSAEKDKRHRATVAEWVATGQPVKAETDAEKHSRIEREALAEGWDAETAKRIADDAMGGDAEAVVHDATHLRDCVLKAGYPDSLAKSFVACGFSPSAAVRALLDAGKNPHDRARLQVQMMGLRMNNQSVNKWKNCQ